MSSGTSLVKSALKKIGAHSIMAPADAESIEEGFKTLNAMLQLWLSEGINLGINPLQAPGDEVDEPADTTQAIIDNLAIACSPDYDNGGNIVSERLLANATTGYNRVKNLYQEFDIPNKVVSSTLPRGAGNTRGRDSRVFAGKGTTVASSDA